MVWGLRIMNSMGRLMALFILLDQCVFADLIVKSCRQLNYCSGHGTCIAKDIGADLDSCACFDGWGSVTDVALSPSPDCSKRICPKGPAWGDLVDPKLANASSMAKTSRFDAECSAAGICGEGGNCECFKGFSGVACERRMCPGSKGGMKTTCSNRGQCLSIKQLSKMPDAFPLTDKVHFYGLKAADEKYWDEDRVFGCYCESPGWKTGFGDGEMQVGEYHGPACEFRRCPSGDDPLTLLDETDCFNKSQHGNTGRGERGNKCYVPCSNRGICNENTGECTCFKGHTGNSCGVMVNSCGGSNLKVKATANATNS